jgi:hypothetical protein
MCIGEHQRLCGSPTMVVSVVLGKVSSCDGLLNVKHWVTTERGQNGRLFACYNDNTFLALLAHIIPFCAHCGGRLIGANAAAVRRLGRRGNPVLRPSDFIQAGPALATNTDGRIGFFSWQRSPSAAQSRRRRAGFVAVSHLAWRRGQVILRGSPLISSSARLATRWVPGMLAPGPSVRAVATSDQTFLRGGHE